MQRVLQRKGVMSMPGSVGAFNVDHQYVGFVNPIEMVNKAMVRTAAVDPGIDAAFLDANTVIQLTTGTLLPQQTTFTVPGLTGEYYRRASFRVCSEQVSQFVTAGVLISQARVSTLDNGSLGLLYGNLAQSLINTVSGDVIKGDTVPMRQYLAAIPAATPVRRPIDELRDLYYPTGDQVTTPAMFRGSCERQLRVNPVLYLARAIGHGDDWPYRSLNDFITAITSWTTGLATTHDLPDLPDNLAMRVLSAAQAQDEVHLLAGALEGTSPLRSFFSENLFTNDDRSTNTGVEVPHIMLRRLNGGSWASPKASDFQLNASAFINATTFKLYQLMVPYIFLLRWSLRYIDMHLLKRLTYQFKTYHPAKEEFVEAFDFLKKLKLPPSLESLLAVKNNQAFNVGPAAYKLDSDSLLQASYLNDYCATQTHRSLYGVNGLVEVTYAFFQTLQRQKLVDDVSWNRVAALFQHQVQLPDQISFNADQLETQNNALFLHPRSGMAMHVDDVPTSGLAFDKYLSFQLRWLVTNQVDDVSFIYGTSSARANCRDRAAVSTGRNHLQHNTDVAGLRAVAEHGYHLAGTVNARTIGDGNLVMVERLSKHSSDSSAKKENSFLRLIPACDFFDVHHAFRGNETKPQTTVFRARGTDDFFSQLKVPRADANTAAALWPYMNHLRDAARTGVKDNENIIREDRLYADYNYYAHETAGYGQDVLLLGFARNQIIADTGMYVQSACFNKILPVDIEEEEPSYVIPVLSADSFSAIGGLKTYGYSTT